LLASAYRRSLEVAEAVSLQSIAFPSISTGVYGYPVKPAARIAVATAREFVESTKRLREVIFCCFSAADLAVVRAVGRTVQALCERVLDGDASVAALSTPRLAALLERVVREADHTAIEDSAYLEALGLPRPGRVRRSVDVWIGLLDHAPSREWEGHLTERDADGRDALEVILDKGCLARRLLAAAGDGSDKPRLVDAYRRLAGSLRENRVFGVA